MIDYTPGCAKIWEFADLGENSSAQNRFSPRSAELASQDRTSPFSGAFSAQTRYRKEFPLQGSFAPSTIAEPITVHSRTLSPRKSHILGPHENFAIVCGVVDIADATAEVFVLAVALQPECVLKTIPKTFFLRLKQHSKENTSKTVLFPRNCLIPNEYVFCNCAIVWKIIPEPSFV